MELYPIKFFPIYKNKIWGGNKLKNLLRKNIDESNIGESWEISTNKDSISIIKNGIFKNMKLTELINKYPYKIMGDTYKTNNNFPLLLKFIDATKKLSVQVHPDDDFASKYESGSGKTEMWYILDADEQAKLYIGLNNITNKDQLENIIKNGKLQNHLNTINVKKGDFFYIPSGTVHAIGGGIMLVEIQQNSNTTYRLFDWNRVDENGNSRDLHLKKGVLATNINNTEVHNSVLYEKQADDYRREILTLSKYFVTEKITNQGSISLDFNNFVLITCIKNKGDIIYDNNKKEKLSLGESVLLPAGLNNIKIKGDLEFLYMFIPDDVNNFKIKLKNEGYKILT